MCDFERILSSKYLQKPRIEIAPAIMANIIAINITYRYRFNNLITLTITEIAAVAAITIAEAIIHGILSASVNRCLIFITF
jgi:hypothetical protein